MNLRERVSSYVPGGRTSRRVLIAVAIGVSAVLVPALGFNVWLRVTHTAILVNRSASMPLGWYQQHAVPDALQRGDIVCVQATDSQAPAFLRAAAKDHPNWSYETLLKRVAGVAGDRVTYDGVAVSINDQPLPLSTLRAADSNGAPLPRPPFPLTLQPGEVWLASSHADGFDSRYFGPVSAQIVTCTATPWLTF